MNVAATPAPSPDTPPLSEGARILNVFIAPSKTFNDLRINNSWWAPWVLIAIVSLIFMFVMSQQIGFDQISKNEIAHSSRADQFEKLPADQQAKQIAMSTTITKYISYAIPVVSLIFYVVIAAVLLGVFKLGANAQISFKTALAIVIYGSLPGIISALLGIVSMFAGVDREGFNINNPVASNPAYFIERGGNKFLYAMASALDVFVIWTIVLIGIGFACNTKTKRTTAIVMVALTYLAYKVITGGLGAAFG